MKIFKIEDYLIKNLLRLLNTVDTNISHEEFKYAMSQKESLLELCFFYLNLKLLYIKFLIEANQSSAEKETTSIKEILMMIDLFQYEDLNPSKKLRSLKENLNKKYHQLDKRKSVLDAGRINLNQKEAVMRLKSQIGNINVINPSKELYDFDNNTYELKPLFDLYFYKYTNIKTVLMKFWYKINNRERFLKEFLNIALMLRSTTQIARLIQKILRIFYVFFFITSVFSW